MSVLNQASPSTVSSDPACTPRPSACPGLLRIVAARDGGICRIKLPGCELSAAQARAIAAASAKYAAGVIELTNRANLQVRGVKPGEEAALIAALVEAGLGPSPATGGANCASTLAVADYAAAAARALTQSAADDVRNVMISPAAGRDPSALFDTRPLCADLLALLQSEARFAALSPKFALLLDGGERLARVDHPHDVWLAATQSADGVRFVVGLAGCPPESESANVGTDAEAEAEALSPSEQPGPHSDAKKTRADGTYALAALLPSQVAALVRALLFTFLDLAAADATRMRHLLATHSADELLRHAQRYVDFPLAHDASLAGWHRATRADASLRLGAHPQRDAGLWHAGGQPPLGRLDADTLHGLAALSEQYGNDTLRITPWQSVLLPDIATHAVDAVLRKLTKLGLACDSAQAITHLIACAGSSGCAKSLADTKADALLLATRLPAGVDMHLSGCTRSCAAAHCAPYTLLAAAPGLYELYRRDGRPGFGQRIAADPLTIDEAADMLERLARSDTHA
ncbi:oxidoreductase [Paraburkholderia ginsengiterrae]|uniref:Oxidoreductase n=1 Tax=Paraburkholderia ginsengiterrae TaxID=1462993 RepID=A0ABX2V1U7_9BURK|nr:oxidoreductase [Paraburkholderia ginsengiterrae]